MKTDAGREAGAGLRYLAFASALGAAATALLAPIEDHVGAFLLVLAAWALVCWRTWRRLARQPGAGAGEKGRAAFILAVAVFLRLPLVLVAPTPSTDAYRYSWEGRVSNAGYDPYRLAPAAPELAALRLTQDARINNPGLTTIYPPLAQAAFRAVAAVSADARAQKAFFAFCDLLACILLMSLLARRGLSRAWAALYAWHPLVVVEFSAAGHLDSLMILALLAGVELWETGREELGVLAWAAAVLVKVVPIVLLPWLLARRPRLAALLAAVAAAGLLPALPGLGAENGGIAAFASGWLANPCLYALLSPVVASPAARRVLLACAAGAFCLFWARRSGEDPARYLCGAFLAVLLASPVVQPWYVLWSLPFALLTSNTTALAWSWVVGLMYFAIDPALGESLPWGRLLWLGEYALVYGLLGGGVLRWCHDAARRRTHKQDMETAWTH